MTNCVFCLDTYEFAIVENRLAYAIYDKFPVNEGHMLIMPKKHIEGPFNLTKEEFESIYDLINECKVILDNRFKPDGYNIGINYNEAAGQTIFHLHVHLIPRYLGDVEEPRGGVRNFKKPMVDYPLP